MVRINDRRFVNTINFAILEIGSFFLSNNNLCIKTGDNEAYNFVEEEIIYLCDKASVEMVDVEINFFDKG